MTDAYLLALEKARLDDMAKLHEFIGKTEARLDYLEEKLLGWKREHKVVKMEIVKGGKFGASDDGGTRLK